MQRRQEGFPSRTRDRASEEQHLQQRASTWRRIAESADCQGSLTKRHIRRSGLHPDGEFELRHLRHGTLCVESPLHRAMACMHRAAASATDSNVLTNSTVLHGMPVISIFKPHAELLLPARRDPEREPCRPWPAACFLAYAWTSACFSLS